jgi:hypothetical protein
LGLQQAVRVEKNFQGLTFGGLPAFLSGSGNYNFWGLAAELSQADSSLSCGLRNPQKFFSTSLGRWFSLLGLS